MNKRLKHGRLGADWSQITVTPGTRAQDRVPALLSSGYPKIRPDGMPQILARLAGEAEQPWRELFRQEPLFLAAELMAFDVQAARYRFDALLESEPTKASAEVSRLSKQLEQWIKRIKRQLPGPFRDTLEGLDRQHHLSQRVSGLAAIKPAMVSRNARTATGFVSRGLGRDYGTMTDGADAEPAPALVAARDARAALVASHRLLIHAIAAFQPIARDAYELRRMDQTVDPAIGLLLAELAASGEVEDRLNRFTARHTTFYYRDLIGQVHAQAARERVLLHLPPSARNLILPAGTTFTARVEGQDPRRYETDTDAPISPARVSATAVLSYQTNPQVSLYSALGAITSVEAALEPASPETDLKRRVFSAPSTAELAMGLDIASDMFTLSEGTRNIEVALNMRRATDLPASSDVVPTKPEAPNPAVEVELRDDPELLRACGFDTIEDGVRVMSYLVKRAAVEQGRSPSMALIYEAAIDKAIGTDALRVLLGRLITLSLIEGADLPSGEFWSRLQHKINAARTELGGLAKSEVGKRVDSMVFEAFAVDDANHFVFEPADMFQKLLGDAFDVTVSTKEGPMRANAVHVMNTGTRGQPGMRLEMAISADLPALAPPPDSDHAAPVISLRYHKQARVCPVTFFERYRLENIGITVSARDVKRLAAFSDDGAVSPDNAFVPFGPRPADGSTLIIAAPEMAAKPVVETHVDFEWSAVPQGHEGFASALTAYPKGTPVPDPKVTVEYLSGNGWSAIHGGRLPLLNRHPYSGAFEPHWHQAGRVQGHSIPAGGAGASDPLPKSRADIRAGAIRLTLSDTADGFGQTRYPRALAEAMRPRMLNLPLPERPIPVAPWVPKIQNLKLSYKAEKIIDLASPESARKGDRVIQILPFGHLRCFPERAHRAIGLFPDRLGLATLYIQLTGPGRRRQLGLLFDIADSGHHRVVPGRAPLGWHYLCDEGWVALPSSAIASDTTDGLMRSGIVTLDLPDNATETSTEMPSGGVWLAVTTDQYGDDPHPVLSAVMTNGVWAHSADPADAAHGAADVVWSLNPPMAGLNTPLEIARRAPPRASEDRGRYLARVSERMRHRARAVTPWDVERLILQEFPEVWAAKCLPHMSRRSPVPAPGQATVVIVRHPGPPGSAPAAQLFDAGTLIRVRQFLERRSVPFARFEVVNPAFDKLLVRASVRFAGQSDDGALTRLLREHLMRALSVWTAPPALSRFGWELNKDMLKAELSGLEFVQDITEFSVLQLTADDDQIYRLADTAQEDNRGGHPGVIRPSRPWALPLSAVEHVLNEIDSTQPIDPTQSGIGRLKVGDMLVVGQETRA